MNVSEFFDAINAFSDHMQRADRIRELTLKVNHVACGECNLWMTRACPREVPNSLTGYSSGPNCEGIICQRFIEKESSAKWRAEQRAELESLTEKAQAASR